MIIREEFSFILNIGSDDGGVGMNFSDMFLGSEIILFWVSESIMIVLGWGGKEEVGFLDREKDTFLAYSATSFINLVLEVVL